MARVQLRQRRRRLGCHGVAWRGGRELHVELGEAAARPQGHGRAGVAAASFQAGMHLDHSIIF
jgi:hypothetical protein